MSGGESTERVRAGVWPPCITYLRVLIDDGGQGAFLLAHLRGGSEAMGRRLEGLTPAAVTYGYLALAAGAWSLQHKNERAATDADQQKGHHIGTPS